MTTPATSPLASDRRLLESLISNPRARRAFRALGLVTVADFVATPRSDLLAVRGFGERSYHQVWERLHEPPPVDPLAAILPARLLSLRLDELGLPGELEALASERCLSTLFDLVARPRDQETWSDARCAELRSALDRAVTVHDHGERVRPPVGSFAAFERRLRAGLSAADWNLLDTLVGFTDRPWPVFLVAERAGRSRDEMQTQIDRLRGVVATAAPAFVDALHSAIESELRAFDQVVDCERLAPGSLLHDAASAGRDRTLPLRVAAFLWPHAYTFRSGYLCGLPATVLDPLVDVLRTRTRPSSLPARLDDLVRAVREHHLGTRRGLVVHVLRRELGLSVHIHPEQGEIATRRQPPVADRIARLLSEHAGPLSLDDLLFRYREAHRSVRLARLLDCLRADSRFLETGPSEWSLREFHLDELEFVRPEAERIRDRICSTNERTDVRATSHPTVSRRTVYLVSHLLQRDPALRYLGRGEFCPRRNVGSTIVAAIADELRRAMGEVPLARFLGNQAASRRRLVARLLRCNRMFVSPAPDRIDLIENYPLDDARLRVLLREVDHTLSHNSGYASLATLSHALVAAELGGAFLTDHFLLDVLRRHGRYDILPDATVAERSLGLPRWIQQRAREVLRAAGEGLTPSQILAEAPELAEFDGALEALLDRDPLLHTGDGMHYEVR